MFSNYQIGLAATTVSAALLSAAIATTAIASSAIATTAIASSEFASAALPPPACSNGVIQGWFKGADSGQTAITITARDKSVLAFRVTPNTRYLDLNGNALSEGLKSRRLKKGIKIVVATTPEPTTLTLLKLENWE